MTNEKKRYKVTICGEEYILISSESEEQVRESARLVDVAMQEIAGKSAVIDQRKVAVLAALQMANNMVKATLTIAQHVKRDQALIAAIDKVVMPSST